MASNFKNGRFRGDIWFDKHVRPRVQEAIARKNKEFARTHKNDTDQQLLDYVRECAAEIKHTPQACEVIGGSFIAKRFGDWEQVVAAAKLPAPGSAPEVTKRLIYRKEYKYQAALFKKERNAQKANNTIRQKERSAAANAEKQLHMEKDAVWGREHREDTDEQLLAYVRRRAGELGRSPLMKEVLGATYISQRFGSWALVLTCAGLPLPKSVAPPKSSTISAYQKRLKAAQEKVPSKM